MNYEETKRLGDESQELINNQAFKEAVWSLRKEWLAEMMQTSSPERIVYLATKMQALEEIPQRLQIFVNDRKSLMVRTKNG